MDEIIKGVITFIKEKWYKRSALAVLMMLVLFVMLWLFSAIDFSKIPPYAYYVILAVLIATILIWLFSTRLPKTPKGKVGFVVAITTETKEQNEKILNDFIVTLRQLLEISHYKYQFHLMIFPAHFSQKIVTSDDAMKYMHNSRSKFLVYGRVRTRKVGGQDCHFLNLDGVVAHRPINQEIQKQFAKEFGELFPRSVQITGEGDIFAFEFTAKWIDLVAMYIIATAALLSGDILYSQDLLEKLEQKMLLVKDDLDAITKIRRRLPARLTDVYTVQADSLFYNWNKTKKPEYLDKIKIYLDKLARIAPSDYSAHLKRAIWLFVIQRDVQGAKKELDKCRTVHSDAIWRYNYAFLLAYEGNLKRASKEYRTAFRCSVESQILEEIEDFILWTLEKETNKVQFYFCLGLLYFYKGGDDKSQALEAFEKFLNLAPNSQFEEQRKMALSYTKDIRK